MKEIKNIIDKYIYDINGEKQIQMFYEIGKYIITNKLNVKDVQLYLRSIYGLSIVFTDRNLNNMIKFSTYDINLLDKFKKITWKNILVIMKHDNSLIDICLECKPTKYELLDYINHNKKLQKNDIIEMDDMLEELKMLRKK